MKKFLSLLLWAVFSTPLLAQPTQQLVTVVVAPDHANWTYKTGEPARFTVTVLQAGNPVKGVKVRYELGLEKLEPTKKDALTLPNGTTVVEGGTLKTPGFLRCVAFAEVGGKEYRGLGTAGYDPARIEPTVANPADFKQFWEGAKADLANVPLDARMTLIPERCTETVNVYHVNLQNWGNARLYGMLCVPKKEGKYPALLKVPGAGIRPYSGDVAMATNGVITLEIGIHGIPVNLEPDVYANLSAGSLSGYQMFNLDDRDRYYYKRVYLGCVRANDFLVSLPQFDGQNLAVTGGSQGGALSLITAALDGRVKWLGAFYPALADVTGYLHGRAGGWPHLFTGKNLDFNKKEDKIRTTGYYDVVNFARTVSQPGYYSWGFNDETCPPTSMYAAYNVIPGKKDLLLALETGHWTFAEQREAMNAWLVEKLKGAK